MDFIIKVADFALNTIFQPFHVTVLQYLGADLAAAMLHL